MTVPSYFPDYQHIDTIRRALWNEREFGRAAVMVGSGMSRNARAVRSGQSLMPIWSDLVGVLIDRLYPLGSGHDKKRKSLSDQSMATSVALKLADEFVAVSGRSALDELITQFIPDSDFSPGTLHRLLVELPWADILTTNYDTLLERAAEASFGRRYGVIRTQSELPSSPRPRIVKLHGSFPSSRPFIFTEEDFRTYPRVFAPFVNLAQQTVLENILCLIGFSGDDPNFLAWTGWVRDHLGHHAPRVYLCGLLDLSHSQRLLLQSRGVIPVDMTPVFADRKELNHSERHALALEWFLLNLRTGRAYQPLEWPTPPRSTSEMDTRLPAILPSAAELPKAEHRHP